MFLLPFFSDVVLGLTVRDVHPDEDAGSTEQEIRGDGFTQDPCCENHRGDGVEIDPCGGFHGTQARYTPVPREETNHGSQAAEEEQVTQNAGTEEGAPGRQSRNEDVVGEDGEDSVEKHLARDEGSPIASGHGLHQQGIECPAEAGQEGQRIAHGGEVEHEAAVENHDGHAGKGQQGAKELQGIDSCGVAIEEAYQEGGEERATADDEGGVGGCGEVHGFILGHEI